MARVAKKAPKPERSAGTATKSSQKKKHRVSGKAKSNHIKKNKHSSGHSEMRGPKITAKGERALGRSSGTKNKKSVRTMIHAETGGSTVTLHTPGRTSENTNLAALWEVSPCPNSSLVCNEDLPTS